MTNTLICGTNSIIGILTEKDKYWHVIKEHFIKAGKKAKQAGASQCNFFSSYAYAKKPGNCPKRIFGYAFFIKFLKKSGRS